MATKYPDVSVQLVGENGNAYNIIGIIRRALVAAEREGVVPEGSSAAWVDAATQCKSYDALLALAMQTVEVR